MRELKAERIKREIRELEDEFCAHQSKCKRKRATRIANSDTGNWCQSDDHYWWEYSCPTCLKRWDEDQ
jgi:hypothetical protein